MKMNAEEVKVGGYQILTLLLLSVNLVIVAMSHALSIFYKYTPNFYCQERNGNDEASPVVDEGIAHARNRTYGCISLSCPGEYLFVAPTQERSVAMEWQLVCERRPLLQAASDVYYGGMLLGGLVSGILADRIGRLPVLAICLYSQGIMAVALYVIQEYQLFLVFRGLQGFFIQGLESCTFILCMELFPSKFRRLVALLALSMRSFGLTILVALSYAIPDWRILQLAVSVPTAVTVLYIWLLPESPRWLLARNKLTEAEMLLERIVHYNRLICGASRSDGEIEKTRDKPAKPKRKRRASSCDDSTKSTELDKSLEESENLLSDVEQDACRRAHASAEEKNVEEMISVNVEGKGDLPASSSAEEIGKASLQLRVDDEKSASNDKAEEAAGQSYLVASREALSNDGNENGKAGKIPRKGFLGLLDSKFIGRTCVVQMCLWFCSSTAFHSLVNLPHRVSTERHVSLTIAAGMEVVVFVIVFLLVSSRVGRRIPLCVSQFLVGAAFFTIAALPLVQPVYSPQWLASLKVAVVTVGRMSNIASFFILRLVMIELFPTISRGTGIGLCIGAEMTGALLMPYISMLNGFVPELSRFVIGALCLCTGLLSLIFPDTSNDALPDSAADARNLGKSRSSEGENPVVLREKLFSEDWVDAGNGIIVNFTDNKNPE